MDNDGVAGSRLLGWHDPPLSAAGQRQAHQVGACLARGAAVDAVYTSPLARARSTAGIVAGALGLTPWPRPGLREICCGELDGLVLKDLRREFPDLWARNLAQDDPSFRWPGGESYREFRSRCLRELGRIAAAHRGRRVVVVTHAGVITQALGTVFGTSPARWSAFRTGNASVTELLWGDDGRRVLRFDARGHLAGPALPV